MTLLVKSTRILRWEPLLNTRDQIEEVILRDCSMSASPYWTSIFSGVGTSAPS